MSTIGWQAVGEHSPKSIKRKGPAQMGEVETGTLLWPNPAERETKPIRYEISKSTRSQDKLHRPRSWFPYIGVTNGTSDSPTSVEDYLTGTRASYGHQDINIVLPGPEARHIVPSKATWPTWRSSVRVCTTRSNGWLTWPNILWFTSTSNARFGR